MLASNDCCVRLSIVLEKFIGSAHVWHDLLDQYTFSVVCVCVQNKGIPFDGSVLLYDRLECIKVSAEAGGPSAVTMRVKFDELHKELHANSVDALEKQVGEPSCGFGL